MFDSQEFFKKLLVQSVMDRKPLSNEHKSAPGHERSNLETICILIFAGREAMKVSFRKNFGAQGIMLPPLIICSLCFACIGVLEFSSINSTHEFIVENGSSDSYLVMGILYSAMAIFILFQGLYLRKQATRSGKDMDYEGDSYLLAFLRWGPSTTRNFAEPFLTLAIGFFISCFNLIGGIPVILCALSVWGYHVIEYLFFPKPLQQRAEELNRNNRSNDRFYEVK